MKIKIIGFKVGQSRPTANRTVFAEFIDDESRTTFNCATSERIGVAVAQVLVKSDFISIRRVND